MFKDWSYKEAVQKAAALKEIGTTEVYLSAPADDAPWELVTKVEPGGSHRLDIATDVWFYAFHPGSGLTFRWSFEIEKRLANGKSNYEIDIEGCQGAMFRLPDAAKSLFQQYLNECADQVEKNGRQYIEIGERELGVAHRLRIASTLQ